MYDPTTMTVGELIERLQDFDKDLPVFAEWEGVWAMVRTENFHVQENIKYQNNQGDEALVIWVEDY